MGMSIEEAQSNLRNIQRYYIKADNETIDFAIDILHKYQKIQEIHKKWFCDYTSAEAYTKISEVLNGNDD